MLQFSVLLVLHQGALVVLIIGPEYLLGLLCGQGGEGASVYEQDFDCPSPEQGEAFFYQLIGDRDLVLIDGAQTPSQDEKVLFVEATEGHQLETLLLLHLYTYLAPFVQVLPNDAPEACPLIIPIRDQVGAVQDEKALGEHLGLLDQQVKGL